MGENVGTLALPWGHLLNPLLLVLVPPAVAGWLVGAWVVRCGWVSRGRLAAAGGVTGALALLSIDPAVAASSLLGAVAAQGGSCPATPTAGTARWRPWARSCPVCFQVP